ncbi:hypothetical protein D9M68_539220 [compost metagenome]
MRVIHRVHGNATDRRADTAPTHCTGLAELAQAVFFVTDFTDGGAAFDVHTADFTRAQTHLSVDAFASQQDGGSAGRADHLGTLARDHFDAVNRRTHRDVADRQRVAGTDRGFDARHQRGAHFQTARSDDVTTFAVGVAQQSDVRRTVGVIFQTLDLRRDTVLVATEVDDTVVLLVATATMTDRDVTVVVTAGTTGLLFQQRRVGLTLVQVGANNLHHATAASRSRLNFYEGHLLHLRKVDFLAVLERDVGLALIATTANESAKALDFALTVEDLHGLDLHLEEQFDGSLDFRLGSVSHDTESDLLILLGNKRGLFGHDRSKNDLHQAFSVHPSISSS